jgi:hypothetical protein
LLIDVTSLVQEWVSGAQTNYGLAITGASGVSVAFASKESEAESHQPELLVVLASAGGPQGPPGPQGSTGATGAQGTAGTTGPPGPQGSTGATGAQGTAGTTGPPGPQGSTGATGLPGSTGPQGPQGPQGTTGTNGTGFTFRNAFDNSATYAVNDVVTFGGSTYVAIAANHGPSNPTPDGNTSAWTLMAQQGAQGAAGATGATGPQGPQGTTGSQGPQGNIGPQGAAGVNGLNGANGVQGSVGPQGPTGDANARMIFPSFYPGNLSGNWVGGQFTLDQPITVLRIAVVAKTATGSLCPAAVFRLTNGTKGQDLVLTPGQNWSDTGAMVMAFAAGDVLQASLRTGSTCAANTGADANLLVEYKMQAAGDTDSCSERLATAFAPALPRIPRTAAPAERPAPALRLAPVAPA